MPPIRLAAALFLLGIAADASAFGWTGHWRVLESQWPAITEKLCKGYNARVLLEDPKNARQKVWYWAALGAVVSDIGYVPGGPRQFSDLAHYLGTGSYTDRLTEDACAKKDVPALAIAAGMRSHYWADRFGHYHGTNKAVAKYTKANVERVLYEDDQPTHRMLEIGTFTVFDLRNGEMRLAKAFIDNVGDRDAVGVAAAILKEAFTGTYGSVLEKLSPPDAEQILHSSYQLAATVCQTLDKVYSDKPADNKSFVELLYSCKDIAFGQKLPKQSQPGPSTLALIRAGFELAGKDPTLERIYEDSIRMVEKVLRDRASEKLPNYNLDSNLPSVKGQYALADVLWDKHQGPKQVPCDIDKFNLVAEGKQSDWRGFAAAGACADCIGRTLSTAASCSSPSGEAGLVTLRKGWLVDVDPGPPPSGASACPPTAVLSGMTFQFDETCSARSPSPVTPIDFLYACHSAQSGIAGREVESALREAQRRLLIR